MCGCWQEKTQGNKLLTIWSPESPTTPVRKRRINQTPDTSPSAYRSVDHRAGTLRNARRRRSPNKFAFAARHHRDRTRAHTATYYPNRHTAPYDGERERGTTCAEHSDRTREVNKLATHMLAARLIAVRGPDRRRRRRRRVCEL